MTTRKEEIKKQLKCDNCGDIDSVLFDGYDIAERLLEGVMFRATPNDKGSYDIALAFDHDQEYFDGFNQKKWFKEGLKHVEEIDFCQCPECGDDVHMGEPE